MTSSPVLDLNNGLKMPALGLGVYLASPADAVNAVSYAIETGYRLIDTAAIYKNERAVGEGIRKSGVARSDIFVTSKLWISDFGYDKALKAFDASLDRLGLDYLDLYLLHWPSPDQFDETISAYRALEKLVADKRLRSVGGSNFTPEQLDALAACTELTPVLNQIELNPSFNQAALRQANAALGVVTQSWSPIGGARDQRAATPILQNAVILALAESHGKTPAQIVLRWHIQHGLSVIPKSAHPKRIAENIDVFDFALTAEEMGRIDALNTGRRAGPDPDRYGLADTSVDISDQ